MFNVKYLYDKKVNNVLGKVQKLKLKNNLALIIFQIKKKLNTN